MILSSQNVLPGELTHTIDELENHCFGCGTENPQGLHVRSVVVLSDAGVPMEVSYLRPAPLQQTFTLVGNHLRREGRKLFHSATLTDSTGKVLAEAKGLFVIVDPAALRSETTT